MIQLKQFQTVVEGYRINGYLAGDNNKPPLVCFHGLTNDAYSFVNIVEYLKNDFHLILIDGPGHGDSDSFKEEDEYTFSTLVQRMFVCIKEITAEKFYVMGHSWGADSALHMAKKAPDQIKGLILLDGGYVFPEFFTSSEEETLASWKSFVEGSIYPTWDDIRQDFQGYTTKKWNDSLDDAIRTTLQKKDGNYVLKSDVHSVLATMKAFYKVPCSTTYGSIECPVLLFHGTLPAGNQAIQNGLNNIKSKLPTIKIIGLDNTQHYPHWDVPHLVAQEIVAWK